VQIYRSVTVRGAGQGKTILEAPGPERVALNVATDQLQVTVEGLTVRGGRRGVQVGTGPAGDVTLRSVRVEGCSAAQNGYDAAVFVFDRAKLTLEDASVSQNHWLGLLTFHNARLTLKHTDVGDNANTGLWTQHDSVVGIEGGSTFAQSGYRAIDATGNSKVAVQDSTISTSGDAGVVARDDATVTLLRAEVSDNSNGGVVAYDRTTVTITGSSITKNTFYGVDVKGSSRATIADSRITGTPSATGSGHFSVALHLEDESQATVTGSTISDNYDAGAMIAESAQATLIGNTITNNGRGASTYSSISVGPSMYGKTQAVSVEISDNTITGNGGCGVAVGSSTGIHIVGHGNMISGNGGGQLCGTTSKFPAGFGGGK
jgi:parallel beta-helix repeat protein